MSKTLIWWEMVLLEAKMIGVQKSNILLSSNVFRITSHPIPFRSPMEIPNLIFLFSSMIIFIFVALLKTVFAVLTSAKKR